MSHGALVLMVPTIETRGEILRSDLRAGDYAQVLDGLVLQGGADMSPSSYGETPQQAEWAGDAARDEYELALVRAFIDAGKPVLGVCRGAQLINVAFGGSLHQDIPAHRSDEYDKHAHDMRIEPGTRLSKLYPGISRGRVTSIHHQAVKQLGSGLVVEAWSDPDGYVEAVRSAGDRYVVGLQWHPEFHPVHRGLLDSSPIMNEFLAAARR